MNNLSEILDKNMHIIKKYSNDRVIKEMIDIIEQPDEYNTVSDEKFKKLGQKTYKDYAKVKGEK